MEWINYVLIALIAAGVAGGVVSVARHAKGKRAVERRLDRFEGVVSEVDLKHKTATVTCDRPVDVEQLRLAVAMLDYQVTAIETQEV